MAYYSAFSELIPVGYRFNPTPEELITCYLLPKARKETSKPYSPIRDCDVYDEESLWMKECEEYDRVFPRNTRYYFTNLKPKTLNGRRKGRETPSGVWKSEKDAKIIAGKNNLHIGSVRSFSYKPKKRNVNPKEMKGRTWRMQEYRLDGQHKDIAGSSTLVLCQVKMIKRGENTNNNSKALIGKDEHMIKSSISTTTREEEAVDDAVVSVPPANNMPHKNAMNIWNTLSSIRTITHEEEEEEVVYAAAATPPVNNMPPQAGDEHLEYVSSLLADDDAFMEELDQFMCEYGK